MMSNAAMKLPQTKNLKKLTLALANLALPICPYFVAVQEAFPARVVSAVRVATHGPFPGSV
jgi:hypothetical protein